MHIGRSGSIRHIARIGGCLLLMAGCTSTTEPEIRIETIPAGSKATSAEAPMLRDALGRMPYTLSLPDHILPPKIPADNPMTREGVNLGRMLFYDPILSGNNEQSCSSCHQQKYAFTDGKRVSIGATGAVGYRNTMTLTNLAWADTLMWDGSASSLEEQAMFPITDPREMDQDIDELAEELKAHPRYAKLFASAFPGEEITVLLVNKALAQFIRTLVSFSAPYDFLAPEDGEGVELTAQQTRGSTLLTERLPKNDPEGTLDLCNVCHDQTKGLRPRPKTEEHGLRGLFTSTGFSNNGLPLSKADLGRYQITKKEEDKGQFNIPTVRNIALTRPYMHDGRFETLHEVMEHYNDHMQDIANLDPRLRGKDGPFRMNLTDEDIDDIVVLLELFTDESFTTNPAFADPMGSGAGVDAVH